MRPPNALGRGTNSDLAFAVAPEKALLLEQAARTADLVDRLQQAVDAATDLRVRGSQGQPVALPELTELRQYRGQLATLVKALQLPDDDEHSVGPMTRSQLARHAANARWSRRG